MRTVIAIALGAALGAGGFALAQHDTHGDAAKVKCRIRCTSPCGRT